MDHELLWRLAVHRASFLKTVEKKKVYTYALDRDSLPDDKTLKNLIGRDFSSSYNREALLDSAKKDFSLFLKQGISVLFIDDESYPEQLRSIHNAPFLLYYRGAKPTFDILSISVVGTRKATGLALEKAFALSFHLARAGVVITSGLAAGTDSAAHKGALSARGLTRAIFGCGIDRIYPASNRELAVRILDGGGTLLSEYPPGVPPTRYNFPERNRIVSALSEAVVVVESPSRSGALITADFALEQGRDVYVINTENPSHSAGEGTKELIEQGAMPIDSASDVIKDLGYDLPEHKATLAVPYNVGSRTVGRFLADRFRAELEGSEMGREGVYYHI